MHNELRINVGQYEEKRAEMHVDALPGEEKARDKWVTDALKHKW